jgi:hypothetical protein
MNKGAQMPAPSLSHVHVAFGWICILAFAIVNGGLREALLIPYLGSFLGTAISGMLLIIAVCAVSFVLVRRRKPRTTYHAIRIGMAWFAATLVFESSFGVLVQGKPLSDLLAAYTFKDGNLWPVVLLTVLVAPRLFFKG